MTRPGKLRRKGIRPGDAPNREVGSEPAPDTPRPDAWWNNLRSRFPRIAIAVTILVGAAAALDWVVSGAEKIKTVAHWFESEKPVLPYVELVIDRSAAMNGLMENEPVIKWVATKQAVLHADLSNREYLALRTFGGPCATDLGRPDLPFSLNAKERISSKLEEIHPDGKGNLANAVIAAMEDFLDKPQFEKVNPRVVIITGSIDACTSDKIDAIKKHRLKRPNVILSFRFIGIGLTDAEQQELKNIKEETKGEVIYVNKREEITRALDMFLVAEPMANSADAMVVILNSCIQRLNTVVKALGKPGATTADMDFQVARDDCKRSNQPYSDLVIKQKAGLGSDVKDLSERAGESLSMRDRIIGVMEKMIAEAKSGDVEGYSLTFKEFADVRDTYNRQVAELNAARERVKATTPEVRFPP